MPEQLSDEDRAAIDLLCREHSWIPKRLAEAAYATGKAAGAREVREELAAAMQPMTKDECLAWWAARGYRWDQTMMLFVKDEDAALGNSGGER